MPFVWATSFESGFYLLVRRASSQADTRRELSTGLVDEGSGQLSIREPGHGSGCRDGGAGGLTLEQALRETDMFLSGGETDAEGILTNYRTYLVNRIERVTGLRSKHFAI
ncbi:hypothetical protein [Mesorhizobium sp. YR577]|uniref:hypothetical protein n=1 Tax=Mesorhizobium sp. YR577 TaxID=1884373 RepID=UPI0008EC42D8|nr:hypothetical protein [Mesorhizobium sp. YR577]SFT57834.1 hypothetical protein SAMN05518861_102307 [Mesorhizobium sp. YR577]